MDRKIVAASNIDIRAEKSKEFQLSTFEGYQDYAAREIERAVLNVKDQLQGMTNADFKKINAAVLKYPGVDDVDFDCTPEIYDPATIDVMHAELTALKGKIFWVHTAAGEATRLGLGTKYVFDLDVLLKALATHPNFQLTDPAAIADKKTLSVQDRDAARAMLDELLNINFGLRHIAQQVIDIIALANTYQEDPVDVLSRQTSLFILNETTVDQIIDELKSVNFLGLNNKKTFFMVQKSGHGYSIENGAVFLDPRSPKKIYNHGAMMQQTAMDNEIFYIDDRGERVFVTSAEYEAMLESMELMIAANIEDLDYLQNAIDLPSIAISLKAGEEGAEMVMTAVSQKEPPQKGGYFAVDKDGVTHCFETDGDPRLHVDDPKPFLRTIKKLNKNMNSFPKPVNMYRKMRAQKLPIHATEKDGYIYPQTPQGDLNFILSTKFVQEKNVRPIRNLKEQSDILNTLLEFKRQDNDPVFRDFIAQFIDIGD